MGFKVSKEQIDEADTSGARWDRPCAPGVYDAEIVYGDDHQSNAGNDTLKFTFVTAATPEAAPEGPVKIDYFVASAWAAKNFLEALDPGALAALKPGEEIEIEAADFVEARCRIKVVSEKYEGNVRPKISQLLPLASAAQKGDGKPAGKANAAPAPATSQPKPSPAPAAAEADDEGPPF